MTVLPVRNPATLETIQSIRVPENSEIDTMVSLSEAALAEWKEVGWDTRRQALGAIADEMDSNAERLALLLTTEQGKPLPESRREISAIASVFRMYSEKELTDLVVISDQSHIQVTREPYGVCAQILPWNYPVGLLGWKLAPCLLAGNTALVKPSPYAPLTVLECIALASKHLPANVVQGVPGDDDVGRYLVSHPRINRISFTGSQAAGRAIMKSCSDDFKRVTLEMGGNDAAIILEDCDLDRRFESIFWGCFFNAGQICVAIKRIYVHENLFDDLVRRFTEKASSLKTGSGAEPGVQMGPLNNQRQLERVEGLVEDAVKKGATVETGGSRMDDSPGYFYRPTVITGVEDSFPIVTEEQFGPAIPILAFKDNEEALARANATNYGLGGSVWTENIEKGLKLAARMECGTAWVNAHMLVEHSVPFGGWKQSGLGRELGDAGLEEFLQTRTLYLKK